MKIIRTVVQYRTWGNLHTRMLSMDKHLTPADITRHLIRTEGLVDAVMIDIVSVKYVFAPQHPWGKEPA